MNAKQFFGVSHWLENWSNHLLPSMGLNGGSVAMNLGKDSNEVCRTLVGWVRERWMTWRTVCT